MIRSYAHFSIWSLFKLWINILCLYQFHIFEINANIFLAGFFGNGMLSDKKYRSLSFEHRISYALILLEAKLFISILADLFVCFS